MDIRDTLQYVRTSDIPAQHKAVLIDALTLALREEMGAQARQQSARLAGAQWQAQEVAQLRGFLDGKVARSWQHADELAMQVASQLHRSLQDVRAKATELGLGVSVDYRRACAFEAERAAQRRELD
jgi:adenosyl cobinamide kinase/adenosyl cobinamide phosphate guanylyltransferase